MKTFTRKQFQDWGKKGGNVNARPEPEGDTPIDRLIIWGGGNVPATAKRLKCGSSVLYAWLNEGKIPYARGVWVEEKTGGEITAQEVWIAASKFNQDTFLKKNRR